MYWLELTIDLAIKSFIYCYYSMQSRNQSSIKSIMYFLLVRKIKIILKYFVSGLFKEESDAEWQKDTNVTIIDTNSNE